NASGLDEYKSGRTLDCLAGPCTRGYSGASVDLLLGTPRSMKRPEVSEHLCFPYCRQPYFVSLALAHTITCTLESRPHDRQASKSRADSQPDPLPDGEVGGARQTCEH